MSTARFDNAKSVEQIDSITEARNPRTVDIDVVSTRDLVGMINNEDRLVADAVAGCLDTLAELVDRAVDAWKRGATIYYFGAGTSGRLGIMDAAELPPTFSVDPDRVVAVHAGGIAAGDHAIEAVEDRDDLGQQSAQAVQSGDIVIGIAASGRTPFVMGALTVARDAGATIAAITSRPDGPLAEIADLHLFADTGPEVITGSTRMKAGSAQKMLLNAFSTALMIRLGKTYSNFMIDVAPSNAKLRGRVLTMLEQATGSSNAECRAALDAADHDTKTALVMLLVDVDADTARRALADANGVVRVALDALGSPGGRSAGGHPDRE